MRPTAATGWASASPATRNRCAATCSATAWRPPARRSSRHPTSGSTRSRPCTTPSSSTSCAARYPAWVAEGHLDDPGQPHVVPYLFALAGFAARHRRDRRPATIRAELGLYAMDTMSLISEGTFDAACVGGARRGSRRRSRAGGEPRGVRRRASAGHHAGPAFFGGSCYFNNAAAAAQRLRDGRVRAGRDRRHRRPPGQRHAGDLLGARRRAVRQRARRSGRRAGSRTSSATPTSAVAAPGEGCDPQRAGARRHR